MARMVHCIKLGREAEGLDFPPYPGELGTKGGLKTDARAQVLTETGQPVPGLYAIGNCSASVMGLSMCENETPKPKASAANEKAPATTKKTMNGRTAGSRTAATMTAIATTRVPAPIAQVVATSGEWRRRSRAPKTV